MASGLRHYEVFASAMDQAESYLREMGASWSLTEELSKPPSESRVNDAEISQPACTAIQLALVILIQHWGVSPSTVTGHSSVRRISSHDIVFSGGFLGNTSDDNE